MSTTEIKERLIRQINDSTDPTILGDLLRFMDLNESKEDIFLLSDAQKYAIIEAEKEIEAGHYQSHEEVMAEMEAWLKE